jgi:hypothetical protein
MVGIANNVDKRVQIPIKDGTAGQDTVCLFIGSGAPTGGNTDGTSTGYGFASKGSLYSDYTNGKLYINTGTGPLYTSWTVVGAQS